MSLTFIKLTVDNKGGGEFGEDDTVDNKGDGDDDFLLNLCGVTHPALLELWITMLLKLVCWWTGVPKFFTMVLLTYF